MKKKIKSILLPFFIVINNIINHFNLNRKYIIYFDGGLGSQIISYMQLIVFENENIEYFVNKDFFNRNESDHIFKKENTYRNWQLEYFGIKSDQFQNVIKSNRLFEHNTIKKTQQLSKFIELKAKYNFSDNFPVSENTLTNIHNSGVNINQDYTAIHLRRGDFIKFSSLVISDEQFIEFLSTVKSIINNKLILISDSILSEYFIKKINALFPESDIKILIGGDEIEMHTIMRFSKILITSNSMYSLSAAMLQKKDAISIVPKYFYGAKEYYYNEVFSKIYNWSILTK